MAVGPTGLLPFPGPGTWRGRSGPEPHKSGSLEGKGVEGASSAAEIDLRETQANRFISNIISEVFCAEGRVRMREALGTCLSPQGGLNGGSGEQGDRSLPCAPTPSQPSPEASSPPTAGTGSWGLCLRLHLGPPAFAKPDRPCPSPPGTGRGRCGVYRLSCLCPPSPPPCPAGWPVSPRDCLPSAQPARPPLGAGLEDRCWPVFPTCACPVGVPPAGAAVRTANCSELRLVGDGLGRSENKAISNDPPLVSCPGGASKVFCAP